MTPKKAKTPSDAPADIPTIAFKDAPAWESWLAKNQAATNGITFFEGQ